MTRLLRWTRWARRAAATSGLLRHPTRAAERVVGRWLDREGHDLYEASGVPALSVLLRFADGGEVVRHWGMASPGVALGRETLFQVLSISKPVTALCALALVDDGVLHLDEPIWRRMPGWRLPAHRTGGFDVEGVTLRRLLAHDAGLGVRGFGWVPPATRTPPRALFEQEGDEATTLRLVAPPGSGLRYSGGGFALVQGLIEEATAAPFAEVVRRRLFEPLGVEASGYEPELDESPDLATRHDAKGRPLPSAGLASCAGSGLVARAEDVATLFALPAPGRRGGPAGRGTLSPGTCATMLTPHAADDRRAVSGLGVFLKERRGDLKYMHAGFDPGWTCRAEGLSRRRVVIVLLSNGEQGQHCVPAMAHALRHRLYDGVP